MEPMLVRNYETDIEAAYVFNKKRLIRVLASLGISDWKAFLYNYQADDTQLMMDEFDKRGWNYKKVSIPFQFRK